MKFLKRLKKDCEEKCGSNVVKKKTIQDKRIDIVKKKKIEKRRF